MNDTVSEEQAILSTLSPAMRRALLAAEPLNAEPEFDTPAEYCQGHESLDGAHMGVTVHCEDNPLCADAWNRFHADRIPDPDRLTVTISPDVTIGTVVALIGRGLVEHAANGRTRDHELTDRGLCVLHALRALQARGEAGTERVDRRAASLARKLENSALVHHVRPHTVSTVMLLLVREGMVTGAQADLFNAVMQELDSQAAGR